MDSKLPSQAPSPSAQTTPAPRRRHFYLFIGLLLALAPAAYYFYSWPVDQELQDLPKVPELYSCDPSEPVKRVAIIGTSPV